MKTEELNILRNSGFIDRVQDYQGGEHGILPGRPPDLPKLLVIPEAQAERSEPSGARASGWEESGVAQHALVGRMSGGERPVKVHCH